MASKRSKTSRGSKKSKASSVDRISTLPDALLIIILSMLPFHSAVRTSVLSKRWRPLCMSLSNLRFNDGYARNSRPQFMNSIDRVLMNRPDQLNIDQFSLTCGGNYDFSMVDNWIAKALDCQVKDLTLNFNFSCGDYKLFDAMYTYGNFEAMRLKWNILLCIPDDVSFSRLKVLGFWFVTFSSYESVEGLLLQCPVLEDLVICGCKALSGVCLTICGSALKNLKVERDECVNEDTELEIVIDTPGLQTLEIADSTLAEIYIDSTLLSLRTAHIDVGFEKYMEYNHSVFELLDHINHVKFLTLTDKAVGALDQESNYHCESRYRFPTFHNLIQLEISIDSWSCWDLLPNILASSPNLQTLVLPWGVDLTNTGFCSWPSVVPDCLSSHLHTVYIGTLHGTDEEMSLVEGLLYGGRGSLRNMSIGLESDSIDSRRESRIRKNLVSLGKHYKTCKIDWIN